MFAQLISPGLAASVAGGCFWVGMAPSPDQRCRAGGAPTGTGICWAGTNPESGRCIGGAVLADI